MSRKSSHIAPVLLAVTALAGLLTLVLAPQAARAATRSVAAVDGLELRAAPKADARVVRRLPILTEVIILGKAKQPATIGGRRDSWVYVQANYCPDSADKSLLCETVYQKGWVADSQLAYGARFKPLSDWRAGRIEAAIGNKYLVALRHRSGRRLYLRLGILDLRHQELPLSGGAQTGPLLRRVPRRVGPALPLRRRGPARQRREPALHRRRRRAL